MASLGFILTVLQSSPQLLQQLRRLVGSVQSALNGFFALKTFSFSSELVSHDLFSWGCIVPRAGLCPCSWPAVEAAAKSNHRSLLAGRCFRSNLIFVDESAYRTSYIFSVFVHFFNLWFCLIMRRRDEWNGIVLAFFMRTFSHSKFSCVTFQASCFDFPVARVYRCLQFLIFSLIFKILKAEEIEIEIEIILLWSI